MRKRIEEYIKDLGVKSVIISTFVFLATIGLTLAGTYHLYNAVKGKIYLQGRINAVQSAKEFDNYLIVRKNTVMLATHVVEEMLRAGEANSEILEYLESESVSIKKFIDKDYTGLYGWINGEYLDGVGWVPDEDYVPTERPWYVETVADDSDVTFVKPYLDDQTKTVLTTMARKLSDGESVLALDVTLGRIQVITEEITQNSPGSYGIVLDKTGQVIAHSDESELGKNYLEETGSLGSILAQRLYSDDEREFELSYDGQKYMVFVEPIEGNWRAISLINTRIFYVPMMIIASLLILFVLLEVIVFVVNIRNLIDKKSALASAEAAQSANRAKSRFLSRMSHEIRTPINAIIGLNNLALRDESISPHARDELNKIGVSARHLLSIINDILDMSRIESGKLELKEEIFCLHDFLEEIHIVIEGQCRDKGLRFVCETEGETDNYLKGDKVKLKQVIINILGNSVKFTDVPGVITFAIRQEEMPGDRVTLHFRMEDTGIGMDSDYIPRLFDPFSQEDSGITSRFGGSGLGLAITKSIVEMMDGEIHVESEKGVGTTFMVSVVLSKAQTPERPVEIQQEDAARVVDLSGLNILIVEDQELNAEVLSDLLDLEDIRSEWAQNGQKGVEAFEQSEEGYFDAILMDVRMPVMDGMAAARAIRQLKRPDAQTIPIIALSANAFEDDVAECLQAGMNMHLSKPVDIDLLLNALRKLAEDGGR
ncbi:MAG: response regulator [Blautia sp.]|nr:response regulator [Blautia sp.]